MSFAIVQHVPHWVWFLLAGLIVLGVKQTLPQRRSIRNATVLPVAMCVLSFYGVISVFAQPVALATWAVGMIAPVVLSQMVGSSRGIRWSSADRSLLVPGSWVPLVLILGLFVTKFGVNMELAMHSDLAFDADFATFVGLAYGAFSGAFLGRGLTMWKVIRQALQSSEATAN
jgi:hypothetical protein